MNQEELESRGAELALKETRLNVLEERLANQENRQELFRAKVIEAVQELLKNEEGYGAVFVSRETLTNLVSEVEELKEQVENAKVAADNANSNIGEVRCNIEYAEIDASQAYDEADSALDAVRDVLSNLKNLL